VHGGGDQEERNSGIPQRCASKADICEAEEVEEMVFQVAQEVSDG